MFHLMDLMDAVLRPGLGPARPVAACEMGDGRRKSLVHIKNDKNGIPLLGVTPLQSVSRRYCMPSDKANEQLKKDRNYYTEIALNLEYIRRVVLAQQYKVEALAYIREALFLHLEWKQETKVTGKSIPGSILVEETKLPSSKIRS